MKAAILEDNDWSADALATIIGLSHSQELVTADDVRREMRPAPHANMVGAAFSAARSLGFIESAGYTTSTTPSRHRGVLRTWTRRTEGIKK